MYHKHSLIKAYVHSPPTDETILKTWLEELVKDIDMKVLMGPFVKYLDVQYNRGISGLVMIETSHISIHVWDEVKPALVQADIYSCKDFDVKTLVNKLAQFDVASLNYLTVDRNNTLKVIEEYNLYA